MLVTFTTSAYSDITMFGTAAVALLKLMGQSGNVPGAIMSEDVPAALEKLKASLLEVSDEPEEQPPTADDLDDDEKEAAVGLGKRAGPLISLLEAAIKSKENVIWNGS